ncbi:Coiled-coil domain-containing protein 84 [Sorochytrium milnesiophthora]
MTAVHTRGAIARLLLYNNTGNVALTDWYGQATVALVNELAEAQGMLQTLCSQTMQQHGSPPAQRELLERFVVSHLLVTRALRSSWVDTFRSFLKLFDVVIDMVKASPANQPRHLALAKQQVHFLKRLSVQAERLDPEQRKRGFHDKTFVQEAVNALVKLFHAFRTTLAYKHEALWALNTMVSYMRAARAFSSLADCNLIPFELADSHFNARYEYDNAESTFCAFPPREQVLFLYYLARDCFEEGEYSTALPYLTQAYSLCPGQASKMKQKLLSMLVACRMLKGYLPTDALLCRYGTDTPWRDCIYYIRQGHHLNAVACVERHEAFFEANGVLDFLLDVSQRMVLRNLFRKVVGVWLQISPPEGRKPPSIPCQVFIPAVEVSFGTQFWDDMPGSKESYILVMLTSLISCGYAKGYVSYKTQRYVTPRADTISGIFPPPSDVFYPRREYESAAAAAASQSQEDENRHVHSTSHKTATSSVLQRFSKKLQQHIGNLKPTSPLRSTLELRPIWCLFCECDVRPTAEELVAAVEVASVHIIRHLARSEHCTNVHAWYQQHRPGPQQPRAHFIIDEATLRDFERARAAVIAAAVSPALPGEPLKPEEAAPTTNRRLTDVPRPGTASSSTQGTVHDPNAVPPWLLDAEADSAVPLGPSEQEFRRHLYLERKRKLNPNRVKSGDASSSSWMPDFGSVWNSKSRKRARKAYQRVVDRSLPDKM